MTALALLGGISGGAGGMTDQGKATSGVTSSFGNFGGLNFQGGNSGGSDGATPYVLIGVGALASVALVLSLRR